MTTRTFALRSALALSQEAFGRLIGVSQDTISRLERGAPERAIHTAMLDVVARGHQMPHLIADAFDASATSVPSPCADADLPAVASGQSLVG